MELARVDVDGGCLVWHLCRVPSARAHHSRGEPRGAAGSASLQGIGRAARKRPLALQR
jgi:hypothetical protein